MAFRRKGKKRAAARRRVSRKRMPARSKKSFKRSARSSKLSPTANIAVVVESQEQAALAWNTLYNTAMTPAIAAAGVQVPWANQNPTGFGIIMSIAFPRFNTMMSNYRYFRITEVEYVYDAPANTFQAGGTGAETVPKVWMSMDRSGQFEETTFAQLVDKGIKPKLFTKDLRVKYAPNIVCTVNSGVNGVVPGNTTTGNVVNSSGAAISIQKKRNWMSTTGSTSQTGQIPIIPFLGHQIYFEAGSVGPGQAGPTWSVTIRAEFKRPIGL